MTKPKWLPEVPDLPYCEGSPDGDLAPSDMHKWAEDYALAAVEAALEEAAQLVELEYAKDHQGVLRLKQIAGHIRALKEKP